MARRFSTQRIKSNQSYTVEEAAEIVGVTQQTIRAWIKAGLSTLCAKRPILILGFELRAFLQVRSIRTKRPTNLGEFYCFRCRAPRKPFGMMADYIPTNDIAGRLVTLCGVCDGTCCQITSKASLTELSQILDIAIGPPDQPKRTHQTPPKS